MLLVILKVFVPCPDTRVHTPIFHCYMSEDIGDRFDMQRCLVFLNDTFCSKDDIKISYDNSSCHDVLEITSSSEGNHVIICNGMAWWLPLVITSSILIFFHLIGCVVITKHLSKILDPIKMLMKSTSKLCSYANCFVPAWNENEVEERQIIQDFLQSPNKSTLKGQEISKGICHPKNQQKNLVFNLASNMGLI